MKKDLTSPSTGTSGRERPPELYIPGLSRDSNFGVGGVLVGQTCFQGTLLDIYVDFGEGHGPPHYVAVGSC